MADIRGITPDEGEYYKTTLATDYVPTIVKIGSQDKFVPNINASKWGDECWLNINMPDVVNDEKETFTDEKIELTIGEKTHRFYELDKDNLEYEIEFASRPASNVVTFNLDFPKGLDFRYQDTLYNEWLGGISKAGRYATYEEVLEHGSRPENVDGSYAVYWTKQHNQYQTGKFCHIYRPKLIDADGKETWAAVWIDVPSKTMYITLPAKWMDDARYPVILDPILGYDTIGASNDGDNTTKYADIHQVDATGGNVISYFIQVHQVQNNNEGFKIGLYEAPSTGVNMVGGDAAVDATFAMNSVAVFGLPTISAGLATASGDEFEVLERQNESAGAYKRLVLRDGRLVGALSVGDIDRAGIYTGLIRRAVDVSELKDLLLTDQFGLLSLPAEYRTHVVTGEGIEV